MMECQGGSNDVQVRWNTGSCLHWEVSQNTVFGQVTCPGKRQVNLISQRSLTSAYCSESPQGKHLLFWLHCWGSDQSIEHTSKGIQTAAWRGRWSTVTLTWSPARVSCRMLPQDNPLRESWNTGTVALCYTLKDKPQFIKGTRAGVTEEDLSKSKRQAAHFSGSGMPLQQRLRWLSWRERNGQLELHWAVSPSEKEKERPQVLTTTTSL